MPRNRNHRPPTLSAATIRALVSGGAWSVIGVAAGGLLEYVFFLSLARHLGAESFAVFNFGFIILSMASVLGCVGLLDGVVRMVAYHASRNEYGKVAGSIRDALLLGVGANILIGISIFASADVLARVFLGGASDGTLVIRLFAFLIPLNAVLLLGSAILRAQKKIGRMVLARHGVYRGGRLLLVSVVIVGGYGIFGAFGALAVSLLVAAFILLLQTRVILKGLTAIAAPERMARPLLRFSWPLLLAEGLTQGNSRIGLLIVAALLPTLDLGFYSVAILLASSVQISLVGINVIFLPLASELVGQRAYGEVSRLYKVVGKWLYYLSFPAFLLMLAFPNLIVATLLGQGYELEAGVLRVLALGYFINVVTATNANLIVALGHPSFLIKMRIGGLIANAGLALLLVPVIGLMGAAVGMATAEGVMNVAGLLYVRHRLGVLPFTLSHITFGVAALALTIPLWMSLTSETGPWTAVGAFAGYFLACLLMIPLVGRAGEEERFLLRQLHGRAGTP